MSSSDITKLSQEERALLEAYLLNNVKRSEKNQEIPRRTVFSPCPLSFAQRRIWFLDQLDPGNTLYNMSSAFSIRGPLHIKALETALQEIVRRHEILRTSFPVLAGEPVQQIAPSIDFALGVVDLQAIPESDRDVETRRRMNDEADYAFDLSQGPLFRATLLTVGPQEHLFIVVMHHIISDGWSMAVLYRELSALYMAFLSETPTPLQDLPIQYADFAVWQREWLHGEVLETQLSYWKKQLEGVPPFLSLPADYRRPALQTHRGARASLQLSEPLTNAIHELSRQENVTPFMTLLAAFAILLYRYTGQSDLVVGSPIAGRNRTDIEDMIGFFLNNLTLRLDLTGNPSFRELIRRVCEVSLRAYAHQDIPFEKLLEDLRIERNLSYSPLFQVFFNMLTLQGHGFHLPGVTIESLPHARPQAKFDVTLYVQESANEFRMHCVYNPDLFTKVRIAEMLQQYHCLLSQVVVQPDQQISGFSLVTPQARSVLPDPHIELPEPQYDSVPAVFMQWARRMPDVPAICQGARVWTYREFAECARTLAQTLVVQGLTPGDVVAVSGRRSVGLIAAMMGAFLSGGILLSIDHTLPITRKQLILQEARAKFFLDVDTNQPLHDGAFDQTLDGLIRIEPDTGQPEGEVKSPHVTSQLLPPLAPDDPAYIFFTSGTTGVPKGVLGCHKGLSHFLDWQRDTFDIHPQDRVAQLTSLSFDVVLREIFLPLTSGATLCLPHDDESDISHRLHWLEYERISVLHTVPTIAQTWLIDIPPSVSLASLRWVFFAGEPLTDTLVKQWRIAFPRGGELVNLYGPTETTLAKCVYQIPHDVLPGVQPIGCPISSTQALVFTGDNHLCGVGEPGEIVIRTPFRTLGYLNAPEEQRTYFVKNPYRNDEQDLLYYTGDQGRYRPDGLLDILGRLDDQVKIRGVRVEPQEVTATLSRHPSVRSGFVTAREDEQGHAFLIAYVVHHTKNHETIERLQSYLSERLPAVMIPTAFVFLDELPLAPNGKVNRRALPAPDQKRSDAAAPFVAPRTPVEETLVNIWKDVLNIAWIGIHDNFFALGGHSLLATQVISRVNSAFGLEIPLRSLFEMPTIAGLAVTITQKQAETLDSEEVEKLLRELGD